ncbi:hypothetical protein MUU46_04610 [Scandinavium sp. TWS1a]|uniref:hypothetical protein n=1 Tax=Scandinavium tedordense TaxID=2926521 RepID=UPI00216636EA|nr:hypothetical protein [Scandinavium tedordense]MCS2169604.1 hypothetical protein [Scandinavium tedordense]
MKFDIHGHAIFCNTDIDNISVYHADSELLDIFSDEDSYEWDTIIVENQGREYLETGEVTSLFNFEREDCTRPFYVVPENIVFRSHTRIYNVYHKLLLICTGGE